MRKAIFTTLFVGSVLAWYGTANAVEITVAHYKRSFIGVPYTIALERGYFKEAGINVTAIKGSRGGGTTVRNVLASKFPFGEVSMPAAYFAWKKGATIKFISGCCSVIGDTLFITKKETPINSIKDLVGKKVGFTNPKGGSEVFLKMSLKAAGIPFDKVNMVSTGGFGAGISALASGGVDVAFMAEPVWSLRRMQRKFKPVFWVKDFAPRTSGIVGITTAAFAKSHGDDLRKLLAARRKAVSFIMSNPEEAGKIVAKAYKMPPVVIVELMKKAVAQKYWTDGSFDIMGMTNMVDGLRLVGVIKPDEKIDWNKMIDRSFLPK